MALQVHLIDDNGKALDVQPLTISGEHSGTEQVLVTTNPQHIHGLFKSISVTTIGTYIVAESSLRGAIVITDILLSAEKKNAGTVTLQFTDSIETVPIFTGVVTDAPVVLSSNLAGGWRGWLNSRIELITNDNIVSSVAIGYYKIKNGEPFSEWDAKR